MPINKVINGFVVQKMSLETGKCIEQEFIASDQVSWENEYGDVVCPDDYDPKFEEFPLEMVQPQVELPSYLISYEEYHPEGNEFESSEIIFKAEDEYHAVNQLLDFYRTSINKVSCIKSTKKL